MCIWTKNVLLIILLVLSLTACAPLPAVTVDAPPTRAVLDESYILGPGDKLKIVVFNHKDLSALCAAGAEVATPTGGVIDEIAAKGRGGNSSGCAVVGEAGMLSLPLVGEIRAAGSTVEAVRKDYADRLANGYLIDPHVSVSISKYRPFFIIGGVQEVGPYEYQADMTISKAIALAGGRSKLAIKGATPRLLRANGELVSRDNITGDTIVLPGDFVEIPWVPPLPNYDMRPRPGSF